MQHEVCVNVSFSDRVIVQHEDSVIVAWMIVPFITFFPLPQLISIARHKTATTVSAWTLLMQWMVAGMYVYYGRSIDQWSIMTSASCNGVLSLTSFVLKFAYDGCSKETWAVHTHKKKDNDKDNEEKHEETSVTV